MLITYIRSSSYKQWEFCQMQYYLTYVLGIPRESGKKADQGTIVHKVMECLALIKKQYQEDPQAKTFTENTIGTIDIDYTKWLEPYELSQKEIDDINRTRTNKYKYNEDAQITKPLTRYGKDLVELLIDKAYNYFQPKSSKVWYPADYKDCVNWTWMILDYENGMFDPRRRNIHEAEPHFDFIIDKDWARYYWELSSGKKLSGKLGIKGTIDLITRVDKGTLEIIDWKSGGRYDWSAKNPTEHKKTYAQFGQDAQLMLYYYAARRMYPEFKNIIVTIFYARDGGPYTICFTDKHLSILEDKLKSRFEEISKCQFPKMIDPNQMDFKCTRICDYYKMLSPDKKTNFCKYMHDQMFIQGMEKLTAEHTTTGFNIGVYEAPGE